MFNKKQIRIATQPSSNIIAQETLQSLPKIYGSIKNKVASNKKTFYRNIRLNQRMTLMKNFSKNQIIHEETNHRLTKIQQPLQKKSAVKEMSLKMTKQLSKKKLTNFSDKYNKLKSFTKHQRHNKSVEADDNESKHKIRFNTIKFLPTLSNDQPFQSEHAGYFSQLNTRSPKSASIKNPLIHLYRQNSIKKANGAIFEEISRQNNSQNRSVLNGSRKDKSRHQKSRIKTDFAISTRHQNTKKSSIAKTQFSKRIDDEKASNRIFRMKENKYYIPSTQQELKQFIQTYKPLNPAFNLKKMVKGSQFQIIPYKNAVYLGNTIPNSGVRNGQGVLITEYSIFEGLFQNNMKTKGFEQNMDGKYVGTFKNDLRDGKGTYEWNNGQFFEGDWKNGKKDGFGIWQSPNGDSYVGQWVNGRQQGKGTHNHKSSVYKGSFMNSLKHGYGQQMFQNGDIFRGNYQNGKPQGNGRYQWKDGGVYEGQFKGGYRDGQGILHQADGSIFKGSFKRDFKHGLGQSTLRSGERYQLQYREGSTVEIRKISQ